MEPGKLERVKVMMAISRGVISKALDDAELMHAAPSIFAGNAFAGVSSRYTFLPTIEVVKGMRKEGWMPVAVAQQRVRLEGREGFQKHMIRFRRAQDLELTVKQNFTEVVLVNSHDRSSAYQLHAGIFRLVCGNGMIVADSTFEKVSIRHNGFDAGKVIDGSFRIIENIPALEHKIEGFQNRQLSASEQKAFAEAALIVKYESLEDAPVRAEKVLQPRRHDDNKTDLWTTLNVVQENVIRGGLKDRAKRTEKGGLFKRTGAVKGIDENIRLNKALWHLAEAMKASK